MVKFLSPPLRDRTCDGGRAQSDRGPGRYEGRRLIRESETALRPVLVRTYERESQNRPFSHSTPLPVASKTDHVVPKVAHGAAHDLAYSILMDYFLHFEKTLFEAHELGAPLCGEYLPDVIERASENWGIDNDKFDIWLAYKPETRMAMAE